MTTIALSKFCEMFPPIDACAVSDTQCLLLLSQPPDPNLPQRQSALVLVDHSTGKALVLGEFPGVSELVLWFRMTAQGVHALVSSPGGRLWELRIDKTVTQIDNAFGDDGPDLYGYLTCCVQHGGFVYVGGMGNQLYRTPLHQARFERADNTFLDQDMIDDDAAIYGLADLGSEALLGVGGGGMILSIQGKQSRRLDSGTNVMINAVCALDSEAFVACGTGGLLLHGSIRGWCKAAEKNPLENFFSDVRVQGDQLLWIGGQKLYESTVGDGWSELVRVPGAPAASRFARGGTSTWSVNSKHLGWTSDGRQWTWLPTDSIGVEESGSAVRRPVK